MLLGAETIIHSFVTLVRFEYVLRVKRFLFYFFFFLFRCCWTSVLFQFFFLHIYHVSDSIIGIVFDKNTWMIYLIVLSWAQFFFSSFRTTIFFLLTCVARWISFLGYFQIWNILNLPWDDPRSIFFSYSGKSTFSIVDDFYSFFIESIEFVIIR